ncbi:MAG: hypothetical protein M3Y74_13675 [Chloroflexota bacterium]|nr:hypothetical protein [Chloroflexota bacterium]
MTRQPRLLDLCCKAGGASMGYWRAGFDVTGVDIEPQPHYPFRFIQANALTVSLSGYDVIAASPPCQAYSITQRLTGRTDHPDLIAPLRERLHASGVPWIIENVVGAPLVDPLMLCGTMFGLRVFRHRLFESNVWLMAFPHLPHRSHGASVKYGDYVSVYGHDAGPCRGVKRSQTLWPAAMGIAWMNRAELAQAIPPAYTEYIGLRLRELLV